MITRKQLDSLTEDDALKCVVSEQRGRQCAPLVISKNFISRHNLRYEEGHKFGEDQLFNFFVTVNTKKVGYTDKKIYYYRIEQNGGSITNSLFNSKQVAEVDSLEHHYYRDSLFNAFKYKEYQKQKHNKLIAYNETMLSNAMMMTMWAGMRCLYPAKNVIKDLTEKGLSPADITRKTIEGHSFRMRVKSEMQFLFRYPLMYWVISFIFRKLNRFVTLK